MKPNRQPPLFWILALTNVVLWLIVLPARLGGF